MTFPASLCYRADVPSEKEKGRERKKISGSSLQCSPPIFNCAFIFQNIKISTYILWKSLLQGPLEGAGSMINHNYVYQSLLFGNMEYVLHSYYMNSQNRMRLLYRKTCLKSISKIDFPVTHVC